ncbi:MAG: hypothetical protein IT360_04130 [Gemmatimonadaceae bacterium]|nr:hypothetical protein [Gemmatimonadaceae bacterium]
MPKSAQLVKLVLLAALLGTGYQAWRWYSRPCCAPPPLGEVVLGTLSSLSVPGARPADFALVVHDGTGALAPVYHYDYDLRFDGRGVAELTYRPGYSPADSLIIVEKFAIDSVTLDVLWDLAAPLRSAPGPREDGDVPVGGSSPSFRLTSEGKLYEVAAWQPNPWHAYALALARQARASIPGEVWARCEAAQERMQAPSER